MKLSKQVTKLYRKAQSKLYPVSEVEEDTN
jgi:hypothetical protein